MNNFFQLLPIILSFLLIACEKNQPPETGKPVPSEKQLEASADNKTTTSNDPGNNPDGPSTLIYPNAQPIEGSTIISGAKNAKTQDFESTLLYSKDPIEKVFDFYQQQLQNKNVKIMNFNLPNRHMTMFMFKEANESKTIHLIRNTEKQGTNIQIMKTLN